MELVVVNTSGTDILVKGTKNRRAFETLFTESSDGDVVFVLDGVVRCYTFDQTALYDYHSCIISLEAGSYKPRDSIQFVTRGLRDAVCKFQLHSPGNDVRLYLHTGIHALAELIHAKSGSTVAQKILPTSWLDRFGGTDLADSFREGCIDRFNKYRL